MHEIAQKYTNTVAFKQEKTKRLKKDETTYFLCDSVLRHPIVISMKKEVTKKSFSKIY